MTNTNTSASTKKEPDVRCPECGSTLYAELASDPFNRHFSCGNLDCQENFNVARARQTPALDALGNKNKGEAKKEEAASMAKLNLGCGKCGKEFVHPKRFETHKVKCKGGKASTTSARRAPSSKPKLALVESDGSVVTKAIGDLKAKREELIAGIPELREIDQAIAALEGVRGGGDSLRPSKPQQRKDHDGSVEEDPDV